MHVARCTTVCTAKNAFQPSIVLWQQFVAARPPIRLHRAASTIATPDSEQPLPQPPSNQGSEEHVQSTPSSQDLEQPPAESAPKKHHYPHESIAAANARQVDDIDPHDLSATLEAHRSSNRASILRQVQSGPDAQAFEPTLNIFRRSNGQFDRGERGGPHPPIHKLKVAKPLKDFPSPDDGNTEPRSAIDPMLRLDGSKSKPKETKKKVKGQPRGPRIQEIINPTQKTFKRGEELLEYEGQNVTQLADTLVPEEQLPWVVKDDAKTMTGAERLSEEISKFHSYMMPTENERKARRAVVQEISRHVSMYAKGYSLDIMGSERSGLALATSDIDLRLTAPPIRGSKLEKAPRYVVRKALGRALVRIDSQLRFNAAYMLVSMRWARYPLISLQHLKSRLDLQVVAANDTVVSQSYIKKYLEENPGLRELFTLIKVTFDARGLSDVFRGGLGSYSLFMMIVASMKIGPQGQTGNLAQQLLSFLSFWSKFDTYSMGISLDPVAETFAKSSRTIITKKQQEELDKLGLLQLGKERAKLGQIDAAQPYLMCLQDPADATNDLGKKGFAIKHIQATLEQLEKTLRQDMADNTRPSLLAPLVGSAYMLNKERRAILEEYGASVEVLEELATEEAAGEMTVERFKEGYAPHLALTEEIAVEDVEGITKEALLDAVEEVEEEMEAGAATEKIAADETHGAIEDKPKVLTSDRTAGRS